MPFCIKIKFWQVLIIWPECFYWLLTDYVSISNIFIANVYSEIGEPIKPTYKYDF